MDEYCVFRRVNRAGGQGPVIGAIERRGGVARVVGMPQFVASKVRFLTSEAFRPNLDADRPLDSAFALNPYSPVTFHDAGDPAFRRVMNDLVDDGAEIEVVPDAQVGGGGWVDRKRLKGRLEELRRLRGRVAELEMEVAAASGPERKRLQTALDIAQKRADMAEVRLAADGIDVATSQD